MLPPRTPMFGRRRRPILNADSVLGLEMRAGGVSGGSEEEDWSEVEGVRRPGVVG